MSTAEYPDALTRRIELLAAASLEDESVALAALIGDLRAEIGGVRAELGSLRAQTGSVHADLDSLGGRLTGAVAAGRSETGALAHHVDELATRLDGVGGRVEGVRDGLLRELRDGLADIPVRTGARLDQLTGRLDELTEQVTEAVTRRVDGVAEDLHRTMAAALDREVRAATGTTAALEDARGALESRLAVLEDALDLMSERIEALARDGASTTTAKLSSLEAGVADLSDRIEGEGRDSAELASSVRAALDGLGSVLDRSLVGLGRSVTTALADSRESNSNELDDVTERLLGAVATMKVEQVAREAASAQALREMQAAVEAKIEDAVAGVVGRAVDAVRSEFGAALSSLRQEVAAEVAALAPRLDELALAGMATQESVRTLGQDVAGTVASLDARLAETDSLVAAGALAAREATDQIAELAEQDRRAVQDARTGVVAATERLVADLAERTDAHVATLGERLDQSLAERVDGVSGRVRALQEELADRLGQVDRYVGESAAASVRAADQSSELVALTAGHREQAERQHQVLRDDVAQAGRDLREELAGKIESQLTTLTGRLRALDATVGVSWSDVSQRVGDLREVVTRSVDATGQVVETLAQVGTAHDALNEVVTGFRTEWPTRTFEVVQGAKAVAEGAVRGIREEVQAQLELVRTELARAVGVVDGASTGLSAGTDRLAQAGAVLVAYLEQRDVLLEQERDRVLHDVLDTFAAGLSSRERTALTGRVSGAVSRRRDGRDAERYRAALGKPVSPTADLPADIRRVVTPGPDEVAVGRVQPQAGAATPAGGPPGGRESAPTGKAAGGSRTALPKVATTREATGISVTATPAGPVKAGPVKVGPVKVGPVKVAAHRAVPASAALAKPVPTRTVPTQATEKTATTRVATAKVATAKAAPVKAAPVKAGTPKTPTTKAPTPKAPTTKTPTSKAPTLKASPPRASTAKAPTPKPANPKAPSPVARKPATRESAPSVGTAPMLIPSGDAEASIVPASPGKSHALSGQNATERRGSGSGASADRRARVDVMPQVRSPDVAIEAAAPTPAPRTPAGPAATPSAPAEDRAETSWGTRPELPADKPADEDEDNAHRRFRRRKS